MKVKCLNLGKFIAKAAGDSAHDQDCDCFDCQMLSNFAERLTAVVENRFGLPSLEPDAEAAIEMVTSGLAAFKRAKRAVLSANDNNIVAKRQTIRRECEKAAAALLSAADLIFELAEMPPEGADSEGQ